jgi:type VI secretion system secreted protein Hcp
MATNMYIKFEEPNLEAGTTAAEHEKDIEVLSWNHGFSQPTSPTRSAAGSGTTEQANHQNLSFTKYLDGASTNMIKQCWTGKQFKKVTLSCYRADGATDNKPVKYLEIEMQNVVIANFSISGGPGDIPVENVSLDYGIVKYNYVGQKRDDGSAGGNKPATHNLESRKVE